MAIRLSKLGGTDFTEEGLKPTTDLVPTLEGVLSVAAVGVAENSYKMLQVADVFTNGPNTAADEFLDATGTNNTVNTGTSTALYSDQSYEYVLDFTDVASGDTTHDPNTFTNVANAFDGNDATAATEAATSNQALGKTFAAKTVAICRARAGGTFRWSGGGTQTIGAEAVLQSYNGTTWSDVGVISTDTYADVAPSSDRTLTTRTKVFLMSTSIQGLRVIYRVVAGSPVTIDASLYTLAYATAVNSSDTVVCDANTITLDGTEKGLIVSTPDSVWNTGSSMTVTASDGTTSTSAQTINSTSKNTGVFSISTLSSGTLKLTFGLATSNTAYSPELKGYGVYVIR